MIAGILLAAGRGRRCGGEKLLLRLGGRPLIEHSLGGCVASTLDGVFVVLPSRRGALANVVRGAFPGAERVRIVENEARDRGMMSSLKAGMRALDERYRAAMVLLADMPRIGPGLIEPLLDVFRERGGVVIPECRGEARHPRILPARLFPEFLRLGDDERGTGVLARHREEIVRVPIGTKVDYVDVDRLEDLDAIAGDVANRAESE